jgi:hypothetical protein
MANVDTIARLKEILAEHSVRTISDLRALSSADFMHLDASVYAWFSTFRDEEVRRLKAASGLNFCLGLSRKTEELAIGAPMEMIIKKLSFFSQTGVLITPKFSPPGKMRRSVPESWYYIVLNYLPLLDAGTLVVMPKAINYLVDESGAQGEGFIIKSRKPKIVSREWFLLKEEIPSLEVIDLSENSLRRQFVEFHEYYGMQEGSSAYIFLPHLANISIELLSSVRQQHGDVFVQYNKTLQRFFDASSKSNSAEKLLDLMSMTDEHIRDIQSQLGKIAKSRSLQHAQVALSIGTGVLCQFSSHDFVKEAGRLLVGGTSLLKYFQFSAAKKAATEGTPFYFPWLIHREACKFAPN